MAKKPKDEIKSIRVNPKNKKQVRKFLEMTEQEGWEVVTEHTRSHKQWSPGQIDYTLRRRASE